MSETPATPVAPAVAPVAAAPKLNAIQLIEQEIGGFLKQREQAIANVHALEGAIQASQQMLATLKSIEAEAKKLATEAVTKVETVAEKVENKVISIADAVKKEL